MRSNQRQPQSSQASSGAPAGLVKITGTLP